MGKNILGRKSPEEINGGGRNILDKSSPGGIIFQAESLIKKNHRHKFPLQKNILGRKSHQEINGGEEKYHKQNFPWERLS